MKTVLYFLILVALTINHPVHMVMLVSIFGAFAICINDEKKSAKKLKEKKLLLKKAQYYNTDCGK